MNLLRVVGLFEKNKIAKKEELIILISTILISLVTSSKFISENLYPESYAGYLFLQLPYFSDVANISATDPVPIKFFFLVVLHLLPIYIYLLRNRFSVDCVKIKTRKIDYFALYMIFFPFLIYAFFSLFKSAVSQKSLDSILTGRIIAFAMEGPIQLGIVYAGAFFTLGTIIILVYKYIMCVLNTSGR